MRGLHSTGPALVFLICLLALPLTARTGRGQTPEAADPRLPFTLGEVLSYEVRWQKVRVGSATVSILPFTEVAGKKAYHFKLEIRSNDFLDKLYKVRDVLEGFVDYNLTGSVLYLRNATGHEKKQIRVEFFPGKHQAVYSNFGGKRPPVEIPAHTFDPVSSFYCMRALPLEQGKTIRFPVTDGKKCFIQQGEVTGTETVTTPAGTFDAFVLIPSTTHFSGVFEKSDDPSVRVWISRDKKRLPVRISIKVFVGSIIFDLLSAT